MAPHQEPLVPPPSSLSVRLSIGSNIVTGCNRNSIIQLKSLKTDSDRRSYIICVYRMLRQSRKISNKVKDFPSCIESEFGAETF